MKKNLEGEFSYRKKFFSVFLTLFLGIIELIILVSIFSRIGVQMYLNPLFHFLTAKMILMFLLSFIFYKDMPPDYTMSPNGYYLEFYCNKFGCYLRGNVYCTLNGKRMKLKDEFGNKTPWLGYNQKIMNKLISSPLFILEN